MTTGGDPAVLHSLVLSPEKFLKPDAELYRNSLASAKRFLDPIASAISQEQHIRKKKKPSSSSQLSQSIRPLGLREVHIDGFTPQQVWEQALRILESCEDVTARDLAVVGSSATAPERHSTNDHAEQLSNGGSSSVDDDDENNLDESRLEVDQEELDSIELNSDDRDASVSLSDGGSSALNDDAELDAKSDGRRPQGPPGSDRFGLNDGFFSIEEFNKQTAFFEQQDSRNPADDEDDEEDVDWDADPFGANADEGMGGEGDSESEEEEEEEEEEKEIIDNDVDFDMDVGTNEETEDRNIRYEEFFDPPALANASKKNGSKQQDRAPLSKTETHLDDEIDRAMLDVHRDLFDSESEQGGDLSDMESGDDAVNLEGLSTHEQRRAKLANEIRKLEAANVAKRDWTLIGEAKAVDRPHNALLEEELDFEHVGKPVPVITAETTNDIESLVKRRIIAKEFNDIPRRHPLALGERVGKKSGRFELDDSKPQQSLAELYETDHLRATDPAYIDGKDAKLQKEHVEIRQLWDCIRSQLDTLSNWHYKPKTPTININVVQDVGTIMMEDARPSAVGGTEAPTMLAPQEIYAPGDGSRNRGEVLLRSGAAVAKDEMTREAKLRRRKREKQKLKKAGPPASKPENATAKSQKVLSDLKKGDVKVIGKEGHLTDIHGREADLSGKRDRRATIKLG